MFTTLHHDLEGLSLERFLSVAQQLQRLQEDLAGPGQFDEICRQEIRWLNQTTGLNGDKDKYEACLRILIDLAKLRWRVIRNGHSIELVTPPTRVTNSREVSEYKTTVRSELSSIIDKQLDDPNVRDFIKRMETPAPRSLGGSILDLIADSRELRSRLLHAIESKNDERVSKCKSAISPYLQLVEADTRDSHTGILLGDIWRYFRYSWSIPATSIPGRQLFYLIRDSAHPFHAVMGIAALSNAPLLLKERDNKIGWTPSATIDTITESVSHDRTNAAFLLTSIFDLLDLNIKSGIESISPQGLLTSDEIENPTNAIVLRLRRTASEFASQRLEILKDGDSEQFLNLQELEQPSSETPQVSDEVLNLEAKVSGDPKMDAVRRAMIIKKRAAELAKLLQARLILHENRSVFVNPETCLRLAQRDDIGSAINTAWMAAKSARAGTNMLEITTCGSIFPYNLILGGKLVSLMMLSPQIADDYKTRYSESTSIISSMMKNALIVKNSNLVFYGTTSLYAHGASQYNRLRLPAGIIAPDQPDIKFEKLGQTTGFGTVQFSPETVTAVDTYVNKQKGYKDVNSVFGEGRSPKLRKLRTGLQLLGFDPSILMLHHQPRLIYGIKLSANAYDFLQRGNLPLPTYISTPELFRDASSRISDYWIERWLSSRLDHSPTLTTLASGLPWKLSNLCPPTEALTDPSQTVATTQATVNTPKVPDAPQSVENGLDLWLSLAKAGHRTCADELSDNDINRLQIDTNLESFLIDRINNGFSIILTGNAGDGKTHLLKRIESQIDKTKASIDLDATAIMEKGSTLPIIAKWRNALAAGNAYCIAANEYPLFKLIQEAKNNLPEDLSNEIARQRRYQLAYGAPAVDELPNCKVIIIDLSLRNPLHPDFAINALKKMLSDPAIVELAKSTNDKTFLWNYKKLSSQIVQKRLSEMFLRLTERGHRSTVRELWIVISRLLFGNASTDDTAPALSKTKWYSESLFNTANYSERFNLIRLLTSLSDPARYSHPRIDWLIEESAMVKPSEWLAGDFPQLDLNHRDQNVSEERFIAVKRRFYFEHINGDKIFELEPSDETHFRNFLTNAQSPDHLHKGQIIKAINLAFCPKPIDGYDRELYLWIGHRFHEQPTRSYIANQVIPAEAFNIFLPRLPQRIEDAFVYQPDHFILEYSYNAKKFRLLLDFQLHTTLMRLAAGFPRHLAPESDLNKLDDFIARLQTVGIPQNRQFFIFSGETRLATKITLDPTFSSYTDVVEL
jgi:hypothetical protein